MTTMPRARGSALAVACGGLIVCAVILGLSASASANGRGSAVADSTASPGRMDAGPVTVPSGGPTGGERVAQHADSTLVRELRGGGYVIFFRHAATDQAQQDTQGEDFENRAAQRNLTDLGRSQATRIGRSITALRIPVGTVLASPMWRCRDTAKLAFGRYEKSLDLVQKSPTSRAARLALLSTSPPAGSNTALVGHQDQLLAIIHAFARDEIKEGSAIVVEPRGSGAFRIIALLTPDDWERIAKEYGAASSDSTADSTNVKRGAKGR